MTTRKAGRWIVTVALDHDAWKLYQGWPMGMKSAKVCSAITMYNTHKKNAKNDAARDKLHDRKVRRLEQDLKVANYRIECIQNGGSDPGDGEGVYLEYLAQTEKKFTDRSIRGGRF